MLVCTTWKARPLSPDQSARMMATWAKIEAQQAEDPSTERLCWYITSDGTEGMTVARVNDGDAAAAFQLQLSLGLGEFLDLSSKIVLDLESAMPAIEAGMAYANG